MRNLTLFSLIALNVSLCFPALARTQSVWLPSIGTVTCNEGVSPKECVGAVVNEVSSFVQFSTSTEYRKGMAEAGYLAEISKMDALVFRRLRLNPFFTTKFPGVMKLQEQLSAILAEHSSSGKGQALESFFGAFSKDLIFQLNGFKGFLEAAYRPIRLQDDCSRMAKGVDFNSYLEYFDCADWYLETNFSGTSQSPELLSVLAHVYGVALQTSRRFEKEIQDQVSPSTRFKFYAPKVEYQINKFKGLSLDALQAAQSKNYSRTSSKVADMRELIEGASRFSRWLPAWILSPKIVLTQKKQAKAPTVGGPTLGF